MRDGERILCLVGAVDGLYIVATRLSSPRVGVCYGSMRGDDNERFMALIQRESIRVSMAGRLETHMACPTRGVDSRGINLSLRGWPTDDACGLLDL